MKRKKPRAKPLETVYGVYDAAGAFFGLYETLEEAQMDIYGPRFRPVSVIREYNLVPRKHHRIER